MNRKGVLASVALALLIVSALPSIAATAQSPTAAVDPYIWEVLRTEDTADVLVVLREQADLEGARLLQTKEEKGWYVYRRLSEVAGRTQRSLRAYLDSLGAPYRAYWIRNQLLVTADTALAGALAGRPEVARLEYLYPATIEPVYPASVPAAGGDAAEWNILRVHADQVWDTLSITGTGAVVGSLDTGVDWTHPALASSYRPWIPGAPSRHDYNWYDGPTGSPEPIDYYFHGTHTVGTIVGDDGAGNQVGMAPGAYWVACPGTRDEPGSPHVNPFDCFQWFLAPTRLDGTDPRPDLAPHVINNSWTAPLDLRDIIHTLYLAGIFYAKSGGNMGPNCGTTTNPGQWPEVTATAAFAQGDTIASWSSRGPVVVDHETVLKPDIAAPGVNVRSCVPGGGYDTYSGTSMAVPHVAGTVALIISARPDLAGRIDTIQHILKSTAEPRIDGQCPPYVGHPNDVWGWGILDAYAAVLAAQTAGLGGIAGTVTDAATSAPLDGVRLDLSDGQGWTLLPRHSDAGGHFSYTGIPTGTYYLTATLYGYLPVTATVTVEEGVTTTQDLALPPAPGHTFSGYVRQAGSGAPLRATLALETTPVTLATDPATGFYSDTVAEGTFWTIVASPGHATQAQPIGFYGDVTRSFTLTAMQDYFWRSSDQPCGPAFDWVDATDGTPRNLDFDGHVLISLGGSFGFYGNTYSNLYIGANGITTFQLPANRWSGPIPNTLTPNNGIYPFSADMNPANGAQGVVYTKRVGNTWIVEYHQVQHAPIGNPETFELLLDMNSGLITMQYLTVSNPAGAVVGVENANGTVATAYPGPLHNGLAVTFHPFTGIYPAEQGMGILAGTVAVSGTAAPLPGALVSATDPQGGLFTATTDLTGTYSLNLCADLYSVAASAAGYLPSGPRSTIVYSGDTTVEHFALEALLPEIVPPAPPPAPVLNPGQTATATITIGNDGAGDLAWSLLEVPAADWLAAFPLGGLIAAGASADVLLTYTAPITTGVYNTSLQITSNDPVSPVVDVVVEMDVAPACVPVTTTEFAWDPPVPIVGQAVAFGAWAGQVRWLTETVGTAEPVHRQSSLALDAAGRPHISYNSYHDPWSILAYAWYDGAAWYTETVDIHSGEYCSLALSTDGHPHISYYDDWLYALKYAWYDGTAWYTTTVASGTVQYYAAYTSLALDGAGHPHISYLANVGNGELHYASYDGVSWTIQTVDTDIGADTIQKSSTSLALDSAGYPHISYYDAMLGHLKYAYYDGSSWNVETVDNTYYVGKSSSLALDAADHPHISYYNELDGGLRYASHDGSAWQIETVDSGGYFLGRHTSLALDQAGLPHIAYFDGENGTVRYAWNTGIAWLMHDWDSAGLSGGYPSLALGSTGRPYLSYAAGWPTTLRYGWTEGGPTPPVTFTWDFGDSGTGTGQSILHTFTAAGTYTVTVAAQNCGPQVLASHPVTVVEAHRVYLPLVFRGVAP